MSLPSNLYPAVFDNVDIDDIAKIALAWEQKWGFIRGGDIAARERRWQMGNSLTVLSSERIGELAKELVGLSKLNFNNTQFDTGDPITIRAARRVGPPANPRAHLERAVWRCRLDQLSGAL